MPRKRRTYRKKKKRTYRKKNYISRVIGGFTAHSDVKLKYVTQFSLDPSVSSYAYAVIRANDCYDPEVAVGGSQPSNFDIWMARYDHFTVKSSNIRVTFLPNTGTNVVQSVVGILKSDSGTVLPTLANLSDLLEQPNNGWSRKVSGGAYDSNNMVSTTSRFNAGRFFGKPMSAVYGSDSLKGTVAASPVEQCYYEIYSYSILGTDPGSIPILAEITYDVRFSERKKSQLS